MTESKSRSYTKLKDDSVLNSSLYLFQFKGLTSLKSNSFFQNSLHLLNYSLISKKCRNEWEPLSWLILLKKYYAIFMKQLSVYCLFWNAFWEQSTPIYTSITFDLKGLWSITYFSVKKMYHIFEWNLSLFFFQTNLFGIRFMYKSSQNFYKDTFI